MKPITPDEVSGINRIPEVVIESFNELIKLNFDGTSATVSQDKVVALIVNKSSCTDMKLTEKKIFDRGYLNIESFYIDAGWKVEYDKPGYNETYKAFFTFSPFKKRK